MHSRKLRDLETSPVGYGCMGLSGGYGVTPTKQEAVKIIRAAFDMGYTLFNTAEFYAMDTVNEELIGEALEDVRNEVALSTKFFFTENWEGKASKYLMQALRTRLEASLRKLRTDHIEIYTQARVNKDIPLEEVAYCMGEFIKEGKILGWGLSQVEAEEVRRAHLITPLTAIESEYSMMERRYEKEVIPLCKELNIGFMAFSPLASSFLTGTIARDTKFEGVDARRVITRFQRDNIIANQGVIELLHRFSVEKGATSSQIALAWMLHKEDFIVPIPGSRKLERIKENFDATYVKFTDQDFDQLEAALCEIKIYGDRKDEDIAKLFTLD